MAKAKNTAEMTKYAQDYGYQLAFLQSSPDLYKVFQQAMAGNWDATKFVAAVKNTGWYKTHGEAYRTNSSLKYSDPATFNQNLASKKASLLDMAGQLGINFSAANINKITEDSVLFGWNDSQVRDVMSRYMKTTATSGGLAGQVRQALAQTAYRNGIKLSDGYINMQAQKVANGTLTTADAQQQLRATYAKALAPGFSKQIDSGMDLYDLASPYMQSMAQTLELNPADVDLFDPTIRKAIAGTPAAAGDKKGAAPTSTPLWEFENSLRTDPRWLKTKNAQDSLMGTTRNVLQSFGLSV